MSIKPVAWTDEEEIKALAENRDCGKMWHNGAVYDAPIPLYAIPDTHRVVPVELLESAVIAAYLSCPEISLELGAIIDKGPTK